MEVREASALYVPQQDPTCPPGYKQTDVGVIPEDWSVKPANQVGTPVRGGSPRPAGDPRYFNGSFIPWLTVAALTNIPASRLVVSETETYLTEEGSLHSRILLPGTLIIANSGATLGVAKILGIKCCANDGIAALLNLSKECSPQYLAYFINTKTTYLRDVVATGNGQPNLNTELIGNFKIPLPPTKAEQEDIAEALSDADALIESLEQLLAKKRQLKQGAMQQLLTGKKRLPGFSGEWEVKRLGDIAQADWGNTSVTKDSYKDYGYEAYSASGQDGFVSWFEHEGLGVVISAIGAQCGKSWLAQGKWTPIKNTIWFMADASKASTEFLFWKTNDRDFWPKSGQAQPFVSVGGVRNARIFLPPTIDEQSAIATLLSDMDADVAALEEQLTKASAIKQGMMQELLTGRIRLV